MNNFKNYLLGENSRKRQFLYLVGLALAGLTCWVALLGYSWVATSWSWLASSALPGTVNSSTLAGQTGLDSNLPISTSILSEADQSTQAWVSEAYGKLPLSFEANHGQTDPQVKALSRGRGYNLFLTSTEAVLTLRKAEAGSSDSASTSKTAVLRMKLKGSNPKPQVEGLGQLPGKTNYFIGNDPKKWRTNIPTYAKVEYQDVYPGVDLVYYGNQRQLEYDFVLAAGADPKTITLGFEGADRLEVDGQGDLVLHTAAGQIRQHRPVVYQEMDGIRQEISGSYVVNDKHQVSFEVGAYDGRKPLIIDPVLSYSTFLGGSEVEENSGRDDGRGIAVDGRGNAYVTGMAQSADFPTRKSLQDFGGIGDVFVAKLNRTGSELIYSTYLGGTDFEVGNGIALDPQGNVYVTGFTFSTDFPTRNPFQAESDGLDAFVAKLNPAGSALVYSTYLGGDGGDEGNAIAVHPSGRVHITGTTDSLDFPTQNPLQEAHGGGFNDAFVAKLNAAGSELSYSTYLGGSGDDRGNGIALDPSGKAYVTGETRSTDFPTKNALQPFKNGITDVFVAKLNSAGSELVYSTYLGGSGGDGAFAIAVQPPGKAYITGGTSSIDFPMANPFQPVFGGVGDAFVAKLNAAGSELVYSTYLGGSDLDFGLGIALDPSGKAYVTGRSDSPNFPTVNALQPFNGGIPDAFVAKLDRTGSELVYSTYLGGIGFDEGVGIAADPSGSAYVTGDTSSFNFPTTPGAFQTARGGPDAGSASDAFIAKISRRNEREE